MLTHTKPTSDVCSRGNGRDAPIIALPEPSLSLSQDAEWCVVRQGGSWRQIRFHDYAEIYGIPGLYEKLFYDILKCNSPQVVCGLLSAELRSSGSPPSNLRVLDVGAGNGMVGEELARMGVEFIVGTDIIREAASAAKRDRPDVYTDYQVADLTDLDAHQSRKLRSHSFNAMTCVAALGFGDIPTAAFVTAFNLVRDGGWVAFNIKEDFLNGNDRSGFSGLIRTVADRGDFEICSQKRYQHRLSTSGEALHYVAVVGRKRRDIN